MGGVAPRYLGDKQHDMRIDGGITRFMVTKDSYMIAVYYHLKDRVPIEGFKQHSVLEESYDSIILHSTPQPHLKGTRKADQRLKLLDIRFYGTRNQQREIKTILLNDVRSYEEQNN